MKIKIFALLLIIISIGCNQNKEFTLIDKNPESAKIAFAYPITDIQIDGNINDWPKKTPRYPISSILENNSEDTQDLHAEFQVGYEKEKKSIYLMVIVTDDVHIIDKNKGSLSDDQDQCLLYLDKQHHPKGSGVNVFSFNELYKEIDDASTSWDSIIKNTSWENLNIAIERKGNQTFYEIQLIFDDPISAGKMIGLDFMIYDNDTLEKSEELTRVSWRNTDGKTNVPFKLGHVLLINKNSETGIINGRLTWKKDSLGYPINKIRIVSKIDPFLWIRESVDTMGQYTAKLPEGEYEILPEWGIYNGGSLQYKINKKGIKVEVVPNEIVSAPDLEIEVIDPLELLPEKGILKENPLNKYDRIDQFIKKYMDFFEIPGVSLAIIENGKISYHNSYGVENTYSGKKVSSETIFEAASITKPVFAFAVCKLAEKGVIDLDKPLHQYLPFEEIAYDERYKMITARHVLSHKTGFPNWRSERMTIDFKPGTQFGYSGEGFEYLKRVIVHITKKDILEVLDEEVLKPLELENFYFEKEDDLFELVAHGHDDNYPHKISLPNEAGMAWSMHTEAKSFAKFVIALLERRGLNTKTYNDLFYKHTVTNKYEDINFDGWESYFGLGIQLEYTPDGFAFGHGGNNGDFKCEFKLYDDLKMGFVIFTNGNTGDQLAYKALEQFLITGKMK
ncbi:serine hydrolase [uncultured Aquimarina sp.]|uniref:serine hydrolase n=1 Tax=uncultured Aquimarina sp. TaxID=575652 RepID=UPI00262E7F05|nr:serine hydrolase [uncultured Aquimarina sp.]